MMIYHLAVIAGQDEGTRFRVDREPVMVGRTPSASVVLHDETVGWEHVVFRVEDGKLFVQNLSARGTRIKGRRISDETRVSVHDEIELSDSCRVRVESQRGGTGHSKMLGLVAALVFALVIGGLAMFFIAGEDAAVQAPVTQSHWRAAYLRLEERMIQWVREDRFPEEGLQLFRDGWRLEAAASPRAAAERWSVLKSMLITLPSPADPDGRRTMTQMAGATRRALEVIMGYDTSASAADFTWQSDAAFGDALVWFVRYRHDLTSRLQEGG